MKKLTRIFMLFLLSALSVSCADSSAVTDHTDRTDDSPAVQTSVPDYETRDLGKREFVFLDNFRNSEVSLRSGNGLRRE